MVENIYRVFWENIGSHNDRLYGRQTNIPFVEDNHLLRKRTVHLNE